MGSSAVTSGPPLTAQDTRPGRGEIPLARALLMSGLARPGVPDRQIIPSPIAPRYATPSARRRGAASRRGCPGRPAQARSSDVFPLPASAEMIVTFPRRCAIQGSDKITPGDQPGSCWSYRQRPALISRPDTCPWPQNLAVDNTSGPGQAILAPPVSVPALLAHCQPRANPRVCCTLMHAQPRFRPVLRCPGAADHQDPVMTSYLPLTCLLPASQQPWPGCGCPGLARQPARGPRAARSLRRRRGAGRLRRPQAA